MDKYQDMIFVEWKELEKKEIGLCKNMWLFKSDKDILCYVRSFKFKKTFQIYFEKKRIDMWK